MPPSTQLSGLFDHADSEAVRKPPGQGEGYWAGAPGAFYNDEDDCLYLTYRYRRPRGAEPDRGFESRLARSEDGVAYEDLCVLHKEDLASPSIERCALNRADDGTWLWYVSYVDGADGRWRVDLLEAESPEAFEGASRIPLFTAASLNEKIRAGARTPNEERIRAEARTTNEERIRAEARTPNVIEGVKDPWVIRIGPVWYMLLSYAAAQSPAGPRELHGAADCYNTGLVRSCSALATSLDGRAWTWQGDVFRPTRSGAWDAYATRLSCLVPHSGGWLGLYDGSASVEGNYEERTGLAVSGDVFTWRTLTPDGPALVSPHGSGSLRYIDSITDGVERFYYFESACRDGSHELRVVYYPETAEELGDEEET